VSLYKKAEIESLVPKSGMVPLKEIVTGKRRFEIPFNQRPWVWKRKNLNDVWADLNKTLGHFYEDGPGSVMKVRNAPTGNPHYFGAFVFYETNTGVLEVVDGQQRLTTLSMIAAILRELANEVSGQTEDASIRGEAKNMVVSLTMWLLADANEGIPRLKLDAQYNEIFRQCVIADVDQKERDKAAKTIKQSAPPGSGSLHIKKGFDDLRAIIRSELESLAEYALVQRIRALTKTIEETFIATQVVVTNEPFALSVFGALNARGVALNAADQIKNELFERSEEKEHEQIKNDWDKIIESVPGGMIEHFLRERHLAFVNPDCSKKLLFVNVRERELESAPRIAAVTTKWRKDAELLNKLTVQKSDPKIKGELARHLRTLHELLGITYSWSLLLSAGSKYFPAEMEVFEKLVRLTLAFCFRARTVEQEDVAKLERTLASSAIGLSRGNMTPKDVAAAMRRANSDGDFVKAFEDFSPKNARVQFYALYALEVHRSKQAGQSLEPFPQSPAQNVEHILPRKLNKSLARIGEWASWRQKNAAEKPIKAHADYVNRIGNLVILEGEINRHVSNYDFPAKQMGAYPGKTSKRKCYKDSGLKLAKELCDQTEYPKWSRAEIEKRQAILTKEAVKVWPLRY
jgi:hypothetical protein